jgi:3-hydroxyacyl-[acyl-carrier-protein] dehydratase
VDCGFANTRRNPIRNSSDGLKRLFEDGIVENQHETKPSSSSAVPTPVQLLAMMPHGLQFLFLDAILEVDEQHVYGRYCFREDEFFYPGHFPERPVTPGVILLESMCQCGMVAQGLYLLAQETSIEAAQQYRFLFTSSEVEWFEQVPPRTIIFMRSELLAWRRRRIRARVKMYNDKGTLLAESVVAGLGVLWSAEAKRHNSPDSTIDQAKEITDTHLEGVSHESR